VTCPEASGIIRESRRAGEQERGAGAGKRRYYPNLLSNDQTKTG